MLSKGILYVKSEPEIGAVAGVQAATSKTKLRWKWVIYVAVGVSVVRR
jgi:hypothetical protein